MGKSGRKRKKKEEEENSIVDDSSTESDSSFIDEKLDYVPYNAPNYTRKYPDSSIGNVEYVVFLSHVEADQPITEGTRMGISRAIRRDCISGVKHLRTVNKFKVGIVFDNANMFLQGNKLTQDLKLKTTIPASATETTGVLTRVPIQMSNKKIYSLLASTRNIIQVRRFMRRVRTGEGVKLEPTQTVAVTFSATQLPEHVYLDHWRHEVNAYVPPVKQCLKCLSWRADVADMCDILQSVKDELTDIENELETNTETCDMVDGSKPSLLDMPVEILLKICSFLDAHFLKYTLSKVCQRFDDILADDHLWKYWVHSKINGIFPTLPRLKIWEETQMDWEAVCVEMNVEMKKWTNVKDTTRHIVVKDVHFASVDTVLLVNNGELCISGGRDRGLALWNVLDITPHDESDNITTFTDAKPKKIRYDAHAGWVWDLAADSIDSATTIYSASWDNTVKAWDLEAGFEPKQTFRCGMSALSVVTIGNEVLAGLYSKKILSFDLRSGPSPTYSYKPHKGPVLALQSYKNMIASLSEDKTMAVWDRVAGKLLLSDIKIPTDKAYPVSISWSPSALYIGDSKGCLHLFNPEDHTYVRTHEIWPEPPLIKPSSKITGCHQSPGNMIVCSDRGEIKFMYNCNPPQEYTNVKSSTFDVTQLRYLNGVLVVGTCDSALEFWVPKERYQH